MKIQISCAAALLLNACVARPLPFEPHPEVEIPTIGPESPAVLASIGEADRSITERNSAILDRTAQRIFDVANELCRSRGAQASASGEQCAFRLTVVDHNPSGASFRAGSIQLGQPFLARIEQEAELAFILAHEVAHGILGHRGNVNSHRRKAQELEADALGRDIMVQAGYPPEAAIQFLTRLAQATGDTSQNSLNYPSYGSRATALRKSLPRIVRVPNRVVGQEGKVPNLHR